MSGAITRKALASMKKMIAHLYVWNGGLQFQGLYRAVCKRRRPIATAKFITARGYDDTAYREMRHIF